MTVSSVKHVAAPHLRVLTVEQFRNKCFPLMKVDDLTKKLLDIEYDQTKPFVLQKKGKFIKEKSPTVIDCDGHVFTIRKIKHRSEILVTRQS
jgi:hypothetical protein